MIFQITTQENEHLGAVGYTCFCPMFECPAEWVQLVSKTVIDEAVIDVDDAMRKLMEQEMYTHLELEHDLWRKVRAVSEVHRNLLKQGIYVMKGEYFDAR
jgi:hypothetical protein